VSCLDCKNFNEPHEVCTLVGLRPPVRVIVYRCPSYINATDGIIEHHVRSGNLNFAAKPRPASTSYTPIKQPSKDAYNRIPEDDIPF